MILLALLAIARAQGIQVILMDLEVFPGKYKYIRNPRLVLTLTLAHYRFINTAKTFISFIEVFCLL